MNLGPMTEEEKTEDRKELRAWKSFTSTAR